MSSDCSIYGPALVLLWLSVAHTLGVLTRAEIIAAVCLPVWRCPWLWGVYWIHLHPGKPLPRWMWRLFSV